MSLPTDDFAAALPADLNRYATPREVIEVPAVVLRPDQPWMARAGGTYDLERYLAVAVVTAADPESGIAELHRIVHVIIATCDQLPGWAFDTAGRAVIDETSGLPFLAAAVRLTYRDCMHTGA